MAVMTLGGVRPEDSLAISLAARALQIVVWLPWWLAMTGQTGAVRTSHPNPLPQLWLRSGSTRDRAPEVGGGDQKLLTTRVQGGAEARQIT